MSTEMEGLSGQRTIEPEGLSGQGTTEPEGLSGQRTIELEGLSGQITTELEGLSSQMTIEPLWQPGQMKTAALRITTLGNQFKDDLLEAGLKDPLWVAIREAVTQKKTPIDPNIIVENDLLLYKNKWYIPNDANIKKRILHDNHDSKLAGHFSIFKTLERLKQNYHWPKIAEEVQDYVRSCDTCQRNKASRHNKYGLLDPLEVPYRPWSSISMDWIVELPESGGCMQIWVIVDWLTKMAHVILPKTGVTAAELAQAFLRVIWKFYSLPDEIIMDRDTKITSLFWQKLMDLMGIISKMTTAFHPQSDGQTERINQILEEYLRHYC